ncbi:hypothetical protein [Sphingomonas dokdonensis]|uniref:Uncharacterized protein n=1 Tax=Sphingomonas dokdonensis TaxID=344880 RepID=A0A245ZHI4_9SPHN|nr:hypothetical protein [Sphingomonas dokdonensis]OWK29206.1 hypothetical protein SPDO_21870 [Sphingomonas dokdonensis]
MKQINIIGSQIVSEKLRYQHENPLTVSDAEAKRLQDGGMLLGDPVDAPAPKTAGKGSAAKRRKAASAAADAAPTSPVPSAPPPPPADDGTPGND